MKLKLTIAILVLVGFMTTPLNAKNNKSLPPGLQKKAAEGRALPPGWQKKLAKGQVLEPDIYERGVVVAPVDPLGIVTIRVEGKLIRLLHATHEIVDILN